jgi:hypothetical protein
MIKLVFRRINEIRKWKLRALLGQENTTTNGNAARNGCVAFMVFAGVLSRSKASTHGFQ